MTFLMPAIFAARTPPQHPGKLAHARKPSRAPRVEYMDSLIYVLFRPKERFLPRNDLLSLSCPPLER